MNNTLLQSIAAAAALVACLGAANAGTIQLTVTDKDGTPVPDVVVTVDAGNKALARPAPAPVVIEQRDLRFVPFLTVLPAGSTLRFVNRDGYDHHVRSTPSGPLGATPPASSFELRLDAGQPAAAADDGYGNPVPATRKRSGASSVDVKVENPGAIGLGCHLHSSMRGQVYVSATPWFGKTDASGVVTIEGVPDGAAEVTVWHADQLQEQPLVRVTVGATPLKSSAQLNFTPRRRRG
ncbi:MAG: plastocyanin [Rhizobiales bacterium]|nr:plastocyanin [Rhizobacter sp.]